MVKVLPPGANVNLNLGKNPMDRLMDTLRVISTVQNIGQQFRQQQQNQEREALSALSVTSNLIGQSDDPSDISYAENIYNSIDHTCGAAYDATYQAVGKSISDAKSSYNQIQSIGDEVGSIMTQNIKLFDVDGNVTVEKRFSDLNKDEIIAYFNQLKSNDGANGEIAKQLGKVKQLKLSLGNRFGMFESGQLKRVPNIKFRDASGSEMSSSEFLASLDRFENQMNIFVEAGFEDGILNEQEAIMILNGDYRNYLNRREEKKSIFSAQAQRTNSNINDANNKIKSIISSMEGKDTMSDVLLNPAFIEQIMPDIQDPNVQALYAEQFAGSPSLTEDVELNARMIANDMGARGKAEILEFYNGRKRGLEAQRDIDRKAAESWGFNFYGEPITAINLSGMHQTEKPKKIDDDQNKKSKEFLDENNDGVPDMVERPELSDEEKKEKEFILKEWESYTVEQKNEYNNDFNTFYEKVTTPAGAVTDNKGTEKTTAVLNQKQLKKAETGFNRFQKKTNNQISMLKKNISDKKKQMNRLTSFSKESLVNRKNIMKEEIKSLEAQLKEKEDLLQNTDINVWLDTMASKKLKKEIEVGKSSAELAKEYLQSRNL